MTLQNYGQGQFGGSDLAKCEKCGQQKEQVHVFGAAWAFACPQCENISLQKAAAELMKREQQK